MLVIYGSIMPRKVKYNIAAIISQMKVFASWIAAGLLMPFLIVLTTSPPAINAPEASKIAVIRMAHEKPAQSPGEIIQKHQMRPLYQSY